MRSVTELRYPHDYSVITFRIQAIITFIRDDHSGRVFSVSALCGLSVSIQIVYEELFHELLDSFRNRYHEILSCAR